jgi:hypothetical protein
MPESPKAVPKVKARAVSHRWSTLALPSLLMKASIKKVGTPLSQFVALTQLPLSPIQDVASARADEL